MSRWLGCHVSIAGGFDQAVQRAVALGCTAMQIFTKNASQWQASPIEPTAAEHFGRVWRESGLGPVIAHDSYLINLASPKPAVWEKSIAALVDELQRCAILGIDSLVMHPGAHVGSGEQAGLERVRQALTEVLAQAPPEVCLLIENTAGQGSCLGADFAHLACLLDGFDSQRLGVCFDTCHAHAAGYDLSTPAGYAATMAALETQIDLERIRAFHVNDCLRAVGSRVDRHTHIGQGTIGRAGFACLLQDGRFADRPMLLETPKGDADEMDRANLELLRELAAGAD
ncbi:MAG: deoxyribonuclease IV [Desulfuromonadales bacterium]|nr:deoxyribonuclease IV [Desulfuromonadales bacterium]